METSAEETADARVQLMAAQMELRSMHTPALRMLTAAFLAAERHNARLPDSFTGRTSSDPVGCASHREPIFTRGYLRRQRLKQEQEQQKQQKQTLYTTRSAELRTRDAESSASTTTFPTHRVMDAFRNDNAICGWGGDKTHSPPYDADMHKHMQKQKHQHISAHTIETDSGFCNDPSAPNTQGGGNAERDDIKKETQEKIEETMHRGWTMQMDTRPDFLEPQLRF